jgi:hypothetical protein
MGSSEATVCPKRNRSFHPLHAIIKAPRSISCKRYVSSWHFPRHSPHSRFNELFQTRIDLFFHKPTVSSQQLKLHCSFFRGKKNPPNLKYLTARSWQSYIQTQARGLNVKHKGSSRLEVMCSNRQCVQAIWLKQKGFWILFGRHPFGLGSDEPKYTDWSSLYISTNLPGKFGEIFLKYRTLEFFTWAKWNHPFTDFVKNKKRNIYKAVKQHTRHFRNQSKHQLEGTGGGGSFQ